MEQELFVRIVKLQPWLHETSKTERETLSSQALKGYKILVYGRFCSYETYAPVNNVLNENTKRHRIICSGQLYKAKDKK